MGIHFRSAISAVRRSPFQAMSAVFVLSLTFFVGAIFALLVFSSSRLLVYFETRPQIIAFVKTDTQEIDIATLQHKLEGDLRIREVSYVSKDEALSIYRKAISNNPQLGELVNTSIFPASLEFSVNDLTYTNDVINEVKQEKIIDSVGFTAAIGNDSDLGDVISRLKNISYYVRIGGLILTAVLGFVSFVVLLSIISMRLVSRKEEIEILRLIGATQRFIRSPIIAEAMFYTVSGALMGWALALILTFYLMPGATKFFGEISIFPQGFMEIFELFGIVLVAELIIGIFIAYMGSYLAVRRAKRVR